MSKIQVILTDNVVGEQATSVFADAKEMLDVILKEKKLIYLNIKICYTLY